MKLFYTGVTKHLSIALIGAVVGGSILLGPSSLANNDATTIGQLPSDPVPTYEKPVTWGKVLTKLNPFRKKQPPPPENEDIINVGPQGQQASRGQLIRIHQPVCAGRHSFSPGMVLATVNNHQLTLRQGSTAAIIALHPFINHPSAQNNPLHTANEGPGIRYCNQTFVVTTAHQVLATSELGCNAATLSNNQGSRSGWAANQ